MENITVKDILEACKGSLLCGDETKEIKAISTNSKEMNRDTLFVPLLGERVNAHKFIESAISCGGATLTQEHDSMNSDKVYIRVKDTKQALQEIASYYRKRMNLPIIAVTGSVGKTTTREMITKALGAKYQVFHTEGNFNSQIGLPLTISRMKTSDEIAVLELGMSERGQIEILTNIVKPNMAVITCIGVAHIEQLKTREAICMEKLDIIKGFEGEGTLFLNGDDEYLSNYRGKLDCPTIFYGTNKDCDYRAEDIRVEGETTQFDLVYDKKRIPVCLNVLGKHNVLNALASIAVAHKAGIEPELSTKQFMDFQGLRQKIYRLEQYTVIDDTYNASLDSMKAAISVLNDLECAGRKIAVLGDMLELGESSSMYHYQVGEYLASKEIQELVLIGREVREIKKAVLTASSDIKIQEFSTNSEITEYLKETLKPEDIVLLKGSNGMNLEEVVKQLV